MLELVLGEVAQVVTKGQKVLPARAQALGYTFRIPNSPVPCALFAGPGIAQARPVPAALGPSRPSLRVRDPHATGESPSVRADGTLRTESDDQRAPFVPGDRSD